MFPAYCIDDYARDHILAATPPSDEPHCPICYEPWQEDGKEKQPIVGTDCNHVYHYRCLFGWLLSNKSTCPTCRRQLIEDNNSAIRDDYDPSWEDLPPALLFGNTQTYMNVFARSHVERFVLDKLQEMRFNNLESENRFADNLCSILDYVVDEWKRWSAEPLWDPLPRRVHELDGHAIAARGIIAFLTVCERRDYLQKPITTEERCFLIRQRRASWRTHSHRWDLDERYFVLYSLAPCYMRIVDFFVQDRPRTDIPIQSAIKTSCPAKQYSSHEVRKEDIELDYREGLQLYNQEFRRPVRRLFTESIQSPWDSILDVDSQEFTTTNKVTIHRYINGLLQRQEVEFFFSRPREDILNYFEPQFFEL